MALVLLVSFLHVETWTVISLPMRLSIAPRVTGDKCFQNSMLWGEREDAEHPHIDLFWPSGLSWTSHSDSRALASTMAQCYFENPGRTISAQGLVSATSTERGQPVFWILCCHYENQCATIANSTSEQVSTNLCFVTPTQDHQWSLWTHQEWPTQTCPSGSLSGCASVRRINISWMKSYKWLPDSTSSFSYITRI